MDNYSRFSRSTAHEAVQIRATLLARGELINVVDILIGGIARDTSLPVVAVDSDFEAVPDLTVQDPRAMVEDADGDTQSTA